VPDEMRFMIMRGMAFGFVLGGTWKLLIVLFLSATLTRISLDYQLITMVLYLGIGGTILIRQGG
jgi:hypothetical protein